VALAGLPFTHFFRVVRGITLKGADFAIWSELVWLVASWVLVLAGLPALQKEGGLMARPRSDIAPASSTPPASGFSRRGGRRLPAPSPKDAGTSIGMVYYYFPTKDDLFLAVVEETYAGVLEKMTAALAPPGAVEERIGQLYRMLGALTDDEMITVRLVVREALVSSNRLSRLLDRFQRGHLSLVAGVLSEGVQTGRIDPRLPFPVLFAATFAMGAASQLLLRVAGDRLPRAAMVNPDTLPDQLVYALFHGIGAQAQPPPAPAPAAHTVTSRRRRR
jgi:AcrR family transcriptional regulator